MKLIEAAYDWAKIPTDLPRQNLILITAKTTSTTLHPEDKEGYKVRIFRPEELHEAARSLAKRPIGLNHIPMENGGLIRGAFTVDSQWNSSTQSIEALIFLPDPYIAMVRRRQAEGKPIEWSVEYTWREERRTEAGVEFFGLCFDRVDLLDGLNAGDKLTSTKLVEGRRALLEAVMIESDGWLNSIEDIKKHMEELETEREKLHKKLYPKIQVPNKEEIEKRLSEIDAEMQGLRLRVGELALQATEKTVKEESLEEAIRLGEPFAGFKNWDACMAIQMKKHDKGTAEKICGKLKAKYEAILKEVSEEDKEPKEEKLEEAEKFEPPEAGNLPEEGKKILSAAYSACRRDHKDYSKERCSKIAWGAVKNAGYVKEEDKWVKHKKESSEEVIDPKSEELKEQKNIEIQQAKKEPVEKPEKEEQGNVEPVKEPKEESKEVGEGVIETPPKKLDEKEPPTSQSQEVEDDKDKKIKELEESIGKLQELTINVETDKANAVKQAKKEMKQELINGLEAILPPFGIYSNFNRGGQRMADTVRRKVHQLKESLKEQE